MIICHQLVLTLAIIMQQIPAVNAGIMTITEHQAHRIAAHRYNFCNRYILFADRGLFLTRAMSLNLSRRRFNP